MVFGWEIIVFGWGIECYRCNNVFALAKAASVTAAPESILATSVTRCSGVSFSIKVWVAESVSCLKTR